MSAREEILDALRRVRERREAVEHPGRFGGWRPDPPPRALDGFVSMFTQAGGEVVHFANGAERKEWLRVFLLDYDSVSMGAGVPSDLEGLGGGRRRDAGHRLLPEDPAGPAEGAAEVSAMLCSSLFRL